MKNKTSIEKSHSKWSNTKLTILALFTALAINLVWITLAFKNNLSNELFYSLIALFGVCSLMGLLAFNVFKR